MGRFLPGVAFSREPKPSRGGFGAVSISVSGGAAGVVDGTSNNKELTVHRDTLKVDDFTLAEAQVRVDFGEEDARRVANLAMDLEERLLIGPLDIEFAIDSNHHLYLLQARSDVACPWKLQTEGIWTLQAEMVCMSSAPMAGLIQQPILEGLAEGYTSLSSQCCAPVHFDFQTVNGFMYKQHPKLNFGWVWSSLFKISSFVSNKAWEGQIQEWQDGVQPELQREVDRLAGVQLADLGDNDLKKHVEDCLCLFRNGTVAHRRFSTAVMPLLDLFAFVRSHMPSFGEKNKLDLIRAIEKDQKRSLRAEWLSHSGERMQTLFKALDDRQRQFLLEGEILANVENLAKENDGEASRAARQLLHGARTWTFGPDVMSQTVFEERDSLSHELARGLKAFDAGKGSKTSKNSVGHGSEILALVPLKHQQEMLKHLDKAIAAGPIREDRFCIHHQVMALLRLALLEAGTRSVMKGALKFKEEMLAVASMEDLLLLLKGHKVPNVSKAYQRLQDARLQKLKAPQRLPLQKVPTTKPEKSSEWMARLKFVHFLPRLSLFKAVEMMLDWQQLDSGVALEKVLEPTVQQHDCLLALPGEAADETSGVVQGPARVGLDGLKPGEEILVVEETSVSYVKHFAQLKGLVRALVRNQPHLQNNQRNLANPRSS